MDNESICGISSEDSLLMTENLVTTDVLAKLRRLKIQESIITATLEKSNFEQDYSTGDPNHRLDWKLYSAKVKNNIIEIKNMFEDIKIATEDSEDNLKNINIEDIKKDILSLNSKIKSLEDFIKTELKSLKLEEKELVKQMNEKPKQDVITKGKPKIQTKQYNEVVPSPIRVLINSPLKCNEVQQFQEFMTKSKNRYGGWNEYNHNIFIQIWNKFYATDDIVTLENNKNEISRNKLVSQFKDEVYEKIPGIKLDDIILHSKWYSEFCYLKRAQQEALDKWRDNKRKIKGRQGKVNSNKSNTLNSKNEKICRKQNETLKYEKPTFRRFQQDHEFGLNQSSMESNSASENSFEIHDEIFGIDQEVPTTIAKQHERIVPKTKSSTFASPTEQWINRCNDSSSHGVSQNTEIDIENVNKLCIPNWRLTLHKY